MPKYLTIHHEKQIDTVLLESRWTEIAMDARADWQMTLYNLALGARFCEWDAPGRHVIEEIFRELGIKCSDIVEIGVTSPSEWRLWQAECGKGMKKCWEIVRCGRTPEVIDAVSAFCPAAVDSLFPGNDNTSRSNRLCWKAVGVLCLETEEGTLSEAAIESERCPFFGYVQQGQERASLVMRLGDGSRLAEPGGTDASLHDCSL